MFKRTVLTLMMGLTLAACSKKAPITPGAAEKPAAKQPASAELTPRDLTPTALEGEWETKSTMDGYIRRMTVTGDVMKFEIFEPSGDLYYSEQLYITVTALNQSEDTNGRQFQIDYTDAESNAYQPEYFDVNGDVVSIGRNPGNPQDYHRMN